jgi:DNA-binding MarR family transcriptional regulator
VTVPLIGQHFRGSEGHSGFLLRQASYEFRSALEGALRPQTLTAAQYTVLSVLARAPGMSGADLARACNTSPQAINGVLATLERQELIERHAHPTHGRILQTELTHEGRRRLERATPAVRRVEAVIEEGLSAEELAAIKNWLVTAAQRMEGIADKQRT